MRHQEEFSDSIRLSYAPSKFEAEYLDEKLDFVVQLADFPSPAGGLFSVSSYFSLMGKFWHFEMK